MHRRLKIFRVSIPVAVLAAPAIAQERVADTVQVTQAEAREVIRRLAVLRVDGNPGDPLAGDDVRQDLDWLREHAAVAAPIIQREIMKSAEASADFAARVARATVDDLDPPLGTHIGLAGLIRFLPDEHREQLLVAAARSIDTAASRAFAAMKDAVDWLDQHPAAPITERIEQDSKVRDAAAVGGALVLSSHLLLLTAYEFRSAALLDSCASTLERPDNDAMVLTLLGGYERYMSAVLDQNLGIAARIKNALDARVARNGGHADHVATTLGPVVDRALGLD